MSNGFGHDWQSAANSICDADFNSFVELGVLFS
jgi:hypothetical protein